MKPNFKAPKELARGYKDKKHLGRLAAAFSCMACRVEKAPRNTRLEIHHKTLFGTGKKASDLLTIILCGFHHRSGKTGHAVHEGIEEWEKKFGTQQSLILETHEKLGVTIYREFLGVEPLGEVEPLEIINNN